MGLVVRLDMGKLLKLKAEAAPKAGRIVARTAFIISEKAIQRVPVDTGALKNSIKSGALSQLEWEVTVGQAYAGFVEFGTSRMAAQPYLIPAVESQRGPFTDAMKELFE